MANERDQKSKAIETALSQIERQFGKGSIMKLGDRPRDLDIPVIPTGVLSIDAVLGVGGWPKGRIVEIYGPESSGKTTLALHAIAAAQRQGGSAAFIDAEHALDPIYAKKLGVDTDELLVSQPDHGEQALRSPSCWCAAAPSTSSSSTPWPPWSPKPSSTAKWAIPSWDSRPGS